MKTIKSQSPYRPKGMLIDVDDKDVKALLDTKEFVSVDIEPESCIKMPDMSWTEKEILAWIIENDIDINYIPARHTKKWVLEELSKLNL